MSAPSPAASAPTSMPARAAALILDAFLDYNERFSDITRRAQRWFERRNWKQAQIDLVWRMDLYDECLVETLGGSKSCSTTASARVRYGPRCVPPTRRRSSRCSTASSPRRSSTRCRAGSSAPAASMRTSSSSRSTPSRPRTSPSRSRATSYIVEQDLREVCTRVLDDYPFANGYADIAASGNRDRRRAGRAFRNPRRPRGVPHRAPAHALLPRAPRVPRRPRAGRARRRGRVVAAARDRARQRRRTACVPTRC